MWQFVAENARGPPLCTPPLGGHVQTTPARTERLHPSPRTQAHDNLPLWCGVCDTGVNPTVSMVQLTNTISSKSGGGVGWWYARTHERIGDGHRLHSLLRYAHTACVVFAAWRGRIGSRDG